MITGYTGLLEKDRSIYENLWLAFDVVLCFQVIEHLSEEKGLVLIKNLEGLARRQVIVTTIVGFLPQGEYDDNLLQEHKSSWMSGELRNLGYKIIGQGLRLI